VVSSYDDWWPAVAVNYLNMKKPFCVAGKPRRKRNYDGGREA
jgi:hypothetical protein